MAQIIDIKAKVMQDERIDRYLHRQMTETEVEAFEQDLQRDVALRQRARFIALSVKAMKKAESGRESEEEGETEPSLRGGYRMVARNPLAKSKKQ